MVRLAQGDFCGEGLSRLSGRSKAVRVYVQRSVLEDAVVIYEHDYKEITIAFRMSLQNSWWLIIEDGKDCELKQ